MFDYLDCLGVKNCKIVGEIKILEKVLHSFEAGRRGKPDELDADIALLIGAFLLKLNARFDLDVCGDYSIENNRLIVRVGGEISDFLFRIPNLKERISKIILEHYNNVHRSSLNLDDFRFDYNFKPQDENLASNEHSGDLGNPIAVAYRNGPYFLPWERYVAVSIRDMIDILTVSTEISPPFWGIGLGESMRELGLLRADGKVLVNALYKGVKLDGIQSIVVHVEHEKELPVEILRGKLGAMISLYLNALGKYYKVDLGNPAISINSLGAWNSGGWKVDSGNREAKPYRDGFATYGVNEDSFSGEDPTKPSATGTFLARYVAVQIVGNGLADFARVSLLCELGSEDVVGLNITTNGTGKLRQAKLEKWVRENIPLRISYGIHLFKLKDPQLYRKIVRSSDFFHNPEFPWNKFEVIYRN